MNSAVKEKWLEALRSGEYKQTKSRLKNENSYCCLGVLSDLFIKETKTGEWDNDDSFVMNNECKNINLHYKVVEWAELLNSNPDCKTKEGESSSLAEENDSGKSFEEIADIIEEQF